MSLYQQTELWVVPDDNSAQNQGVEDRAGFGCSVDNNCLDNKQLTHLLSLSLLQWTELWVVPDDNSTQKQWVEDWERIWWIRTVSTISNN